MPVTVEWMCCITFINLYIFTFLCCSIYFILNFSITKLFMVVSDRDPQIKGICSHFYAGYCKRRREQAPLLKDSAFIVI